MKMRRIAHVNKRESGKTLGGNTNSYRAYQPVRVVVWIKHIFARIRVKA